MKQHVSAIAAWTAVVVMSGAAGWVGASRRSALEPGDKLTAVYRLWSISANIPSMFFGSARLNIRAHEMWERLELQRLGRLPSEEEEKAQFSKMEHAVFSDKPKNQQDIELIKTLLDNVIEYAATESTPQILRQLDETEKYIEEMTRFRQDRADFEQAISAAGIYGKIGALRTYLTARSDFAPHAAQ